MPIQRGNVEFPTLGFSAGAGFDTLASRRPDEFGGWGRGAYRSLGDLAPSSLDWRLQRASVSSYAGGMGDLAPASLNLRLVQSVAGTGLGQLDFSTVFGGLSLQTLALLGIGGYAVYKLFFGTTARVRSRALREARKKYRAETREIRAKYPRFG